MLQQLCFRVVYSLIFISITLLSCREDEEIPKDSLQLYINSNSNLQPFNELIACAGGGQVGFLDDENFPISVYYYNKAGATDIKYYETSSSDIDPSNLALFTNINVTPVPFLNGFMGRFPLSKPQQDVWARTSYIVDDTLWYSKAIKLKYNEKPTLYVPEICKVDSTTSLEPIFSWDEGEDGNVIYFHAVSDASENVISATYTTDRHFQFYNTNNVVLDLTSRDAPKSLQSDKVYNFLLLGVSGDNWVNFISSKVYKTH